jgi:hypothetical protein
MIGRGLLLLAVCGAYIASAAIAADLPAYHPKQVTSPVQKKLKRKKTTAVKPDVLKAKPALERTVRKQPSSEAQTSDVVSLTWQLDPLVANSDGAKREDSASVEAHLLVPQPAKISHPTMIIELTGHVVKTVNTTARLDIRVGKSHRILSWNSDDVKAGKFKIVLNEPTTAGALPDHYAVSALAFVTKDGREGAAMISLERVVLRLGAENTAHIQTDPATPEVTGSISVD